MKHYIPKSSPKILKASMDYYWEHREKKLVYQREYNKRHAERKRELKRKWIAEHPDEWRKYCRDKVRERYHTVPGVKERRAAYNKEYGKVNGEKIRKNKRKYYWEHHAKILAYRRQRRKKLKQAA